MSNKEKTILTILVIATTIVIESAVYCSVFNMGIRPFMEAIEYTLQPVNFGVFVLLAMAKQLLFSGKSLKDSVAIGEEGFGEKFFSYMTTKMMWMGFLLSGWSLYKIF